MAIIANRKFWTEFIDIYHSLPSLWDTNDENYNNRQKRSLALNKLVEKLREVEPNANRDCVKRKINTFRSNFNREIRKIRHSQKEQSAEEYNPTLWYFEHLSFLLNQEKYKCNGASEYSQYDEETTFMASKIGKREVENNELSPNDENSHYENKTFSFVRTSTHSTESEEEPSIANQSVNEASQNEYITKTRYLNLPGNHANQMENPIESVRVPTKRAKLHLKSQDLYSRHQYKSTSSIFRDEASIYGQSWACGFRKLSPHQQLFAKKAIDEILILGQLKLLKFNTVPISANILEESD